MNKKEFALDLGGKKIGVEFNDLADQANGSVLVRSGNTIVLATAVMSEKDKDTDFFPLTVDFEEKFYASGKILGSRYIRREGKPSDEAILSGRIIDRTIRPLFDQDIRREIQIIISVLSIDEFDPDTLAVVAASLALGTSNIPWNGPVSAARIGRHKGSETWETNPSYAFRDDPAYELDLVACGKDGNINMIEVGSHEISNTVAVEALKKASEEIETIQAFQQKIILELGKEKVVLPKLETPETLTALFSEKIESKLLENVFTNKPGKDSIEGLKKEWLELFATTYPEEKKSQAESYYEQKVDDLVHKLAIEKNQRVDGRGLDEVRPLYAQAGGISPILHGSGIFYRGQTHVLSALTLGGPQDAQTIDGMAEGEGKRFMHHYNFPPFSTGETGRAGSTNRRMIGHGALAEKALVPIIPHKELFPYTIRIVSETMASNGSSSMASVCASTLALMDAGVPIKAPVAGIASGLMMASPKEYVLLTDIQGPEDHYGDMDFKVAGTKEGITAIQMDVKVSGIPLSILGEALEKALAARLHILKTIEAELAAPRAEISVNAPKILSLKINPELIGLVIGPGGKMIKGIKEKTGAEINIDDDGTVYVTGKNGSAEKAKAIIEGMTHEYKKGERYEGEVIKLMEFGAFVRIGPNAEGLVHVSEMAGFRIDNVSAYLKVGDRVPVVVKEIDEKKRINLSIKMAQADFIKPKQA